MDGHGLIEGTPIWLLSCTEQQSAPLELVSQGLSRRVGQPLLDDLGDYGLATERESSSIIRSAVEIHGIFAG